MTEGFLNGLPLSFSRFSIDARPAGLVVVDEVRGFAAVGCGPLAPPAPDPVIDRMIAETDRLARAFAERNRPILVFRDSHIPGKAEPPYPPHCEQGSGDDELVSELAWLADCPQATLVAKDCINGFIGGIDPVSGRNRVTDWIAANGVEAVLVAGICTDICVMDFVLTLLSARNHGLAAPLADVVVHEPGCATYDLPREMAETLGLPPVAAHPRRETHHMGLYFMASRGAVLSSDSR